jgi:hypothetical protein
MRRLSFVLPLLALLLVMGCRSKGKFDTPEGTFATLCQAIQNKDAGLYRDCWDPSRVEREGSLSKLESNPELWEELQGIFKGPQKLKSEVKDKRLGKDKIKFEVEAPEAEQGGIGAITMIEIDGEWKMYTW